MLGSLIENNVDLIFKGGTGLMLLIPELKRLSIDIDILNESDNESLNNAFNRIIEGDIFNRWEEDKRTSNYKIAKKQMSHGGGMVSFELQGGIDRGRKFLNTF